MRMIKALEDALKELPTLLQDRDRWDSLIVNRRKPATYRVYAKASSGMRICLHRFEPCHTHEAFDHPHPWPGAFVIMDGGYRMNVSISAEAFQQHAFVSPSAIPPPPVFLMPFILRKWSMYEIDNPNIWHAVVPLETTYTVMVNDTPWPSNVANLNAPTTKGKDLEKMPEDDLRQHLKHFHSLVSEYHAWSKW